MVSASKTNLGRYGGVSGEQRLAERRERLLAAGLERFGTDGFAASSVKSVCVEAGLTERYFYEAFGDREDLLFAVYEQIVEELFGFTVAAVNAAHETAAARARAGLDAFFGVLTTDIRKARVLSIEVVGVSKRLEQRRRRTMHEMAGLIAQNGMELVGPGVKLLVDPQLTALTLVGGTNELLIEWLLNEQRPDPGYLPVHCAQMFVAMYGAAAA